MTVERKVRGKLLEIAVPTTEERAAIYQWLALAPLHQPLGLPRPPTREEFEAARLPLVERIVTGVRFHILRRQGHAMGFFVDYPWSLEPGDRGTRELDIVIADLSERSMGAYYDASMIVAQYMFRYGYAKRLRWRLRARGLNKPPHITRVPGRLIEERQQLDLTTGRMTPVFVYEYTQHEYEGLCVQLGISPAQDYADVPSSIWTHLRTGR